MFSPSNSGGFFPIQVDRRSVEFVAILSHWVMFHGKSSIAVNVPNRFVLISLRSLLPSAGIGMQESIPQCSQRTVRELSIVSAVDVPVFWQWKQMYDPAPSMASRLRYEVEASASIILLIAAPFACFSCRLG